MELGEKTNNYVVQRQLCSVNEKMVCLQPRRWYVFNQEDGMSSTKKMVCLQPRRWYVFNQEDGMSSIKKKAELKFDFSVAATLTY